MSKTLNKNKNTLKKDLLTLSTKIPFLLEVDKRLRKIKEIYESSFHRLAWEIKAMYNRSKVPKDERPASENESKRLSPKVCNFYDHFFFEKPVCLGLFFLGGGGD